MRINSINHYTSTNLTIAKAKKTQNTTIPNTKIEKLPLVVPEYYNISFTGAGNLKLEKRNKKKFEEIKENFTPNARITYEKSQEIAKRFGHSQINLDHIMLATLEQLKEYIETLDAGDSEYKEIQSYKTPLALADSIRVDDLFKDSRKREKFKTVVDEHIQKISDTIKNSDTPKGKAYNIELNNEALEAVNETYITDSGSSMVDEEDASTRFYDSYFMFSIEESENLDVQKRWNDFIYDASAALMLDKIKDEKNYLKFYDNNSEKIWKSLSLNNDVYANYYKDSDSQKYLVSSFTNLINKKDMSFGKLNKENTEIFVFNKDATLDFIEKKIKKEKAKANGKHQVFVFNLHNAYEKQGMITEDNLRMLENKDGAKNNQHIVLLSDEEMLIANTQKDAGLNKILGRYNALSIPTPTGNETIASLTDDTGKEYIKIATGKEFTEEAIRYSVELSNQEEGYFPEKAINYMKHIALYNSDKDIMTLDDIKQFEKENIGVRTKSVSQNEFNIIFDTGKKLDDIVGTPMTKAEAESVVNLILNGRNNVTRGYTTFIEDGSSYGGGRHHIAEAIAGEAGIPMITMNARDFALKDIDYMSQNANFSEMKIQKLVNIAKTQAETNAHKTAMIFIENFDNFGSDPVYGISSIYEQKAFSQLLEEMENIRKNSNVNLVIIGSTNRPELLDEGIMKPFKFLNKIIIYQPQDTKNRSEVLNYYIKKNNFKIAGKTPEDQQKIITGIAQTTRGFTVVDLMYLLDEAKDISKQRGKEAIDKADFTEAYLERVAGRVSEAERSPHSDEIVASHECGHAIALQFMYNLAQEQEKPWHLPESIDFITLDPRGNYSGAMYPRSSQNDNWSFEKIFAELVCDFGGYASEKHFYNMDGSWGITEDMHMATNTARLAVEYMGMGAKTGKISITDSKEKLSERMKENIEDDMQVILKNAEVVSNKIIEAHEGFIKEFADEYKNKVGTGDCIISSEEFNKYLSDWIQKTPKAEEKIKALQKEILDIITKTKNGELACTHS